MAEHTITTTAPEAAPLAKKNGKRTGALTKLMARATTDESGRGGRIRRRRMSFLIDPAVCEPGCFDEDFEIVLESPSLEQELAAAKKYPQDPTAMLMELLKQCVVSCDGEAVRDSDMSREALFEALGMTGRALLGRKFQQINGGGVEAEKKADESTRLLVG